MRVVAALGGNALLERGEKPDASVQQRHVSQAVHALAPLAREHQLIVTHGNGPQVGLLAAESSTDATLNRPYPFDALGAETQGLIGYWLLHAFRNELPDREVACLVTETVVSAEDPAFDRPTKFVGPAYTRAEATDLAAERQWNVAEDGAVWRRVVPSPRPCEVLETPLIRRLLDAGVIVVCAGGGGAPVIRHAAGRLEGVEAVIDKDLTSALLAEVLGADVLLLLTDVSAVETDYATARSRPIRRATPAELRARTFAPGSMGPKIEAACQFVERTGHRAAIGALGDAQDILAGRRGTLITPAAGPG